jgi:hypothetical protein
LQDYLQAGTLSKIVGAQITREPGKLARMTIFMRSATAGSMFARSFAGIVWYDFLFRLARVVSPAHEALLRPFPGLLLRWRCLVRATALIQFVTWFSKGRFGMHIAVLGNFALLKRGCAACRSMPSSMGAQTTTRSMHSRGVLACCMPSLSHCICSPEASLLGM